MNESQVFTNALKYADAAERQAYLDAACAGDPALRAAVESLFRVHANDPDFLERPAASLTGTMDAPAATETAGPATERPGAVLAGRYKLLEVIGEGGMGEVWMAQQTEPVKRLVAAKLIKAGMDSRQVLARFEAERQALALMDHPNIAKVHDAGAAPDGRPFFVMELVKGIPITNYCDEHHLTPRQRMELFLPVCQAVQHAHQKGVIHRDLKPSNVLVARYDDRPVPKVIDFGVAKAAGQPLTEQTLHTGFGAVVGTVEYMSPEQATFNQLDVDTRSDVYSLGVLLYELLAGSPPFARKELERAGMLEMLRVIREQEPSRPSTKLSTAEGLPTLAANRGTEPAKLTRLVRGELDWIVMKALEKDRNRRYETASAFAADVQRYLADEAVQACPPSAAYRVRKFVRRYKGPAAATVLVLLCLLGGIIGTSWGMVRAIEAENGTRSEGIEKDKAAKKAQEQAAVANSIAGSLKQMLGSLVPSAAKGPDYTARQLLDDYADNLESKLADQPAVAADLHVILGKAYACLDARDKAKQHLDRALVLRRNIFGDQHEKYAEVLVEHSRPDASLEWTQCEADLRRALAIYRERGVGGEPVIYALYVLQWLLAERARGDMPAKWSEIEPLLQEGLAEARKFPGQEFPRIVDLYGGCAGAKMARGEYANAEAILHEAITLAQKFYGPDGYPLAWGYFPLADALRRQRKFAEAIQADRQALAIMRKWLPPGHKAIAWELSRLVETLGGADQSHELAKLFPSSADLAELESLYREILKTTNPSRFNLDDPAIAAITGLARFGEFYAHLGHEFGVLGKIEEAERCRKKAALVEAEQADRTKELYRQILDQGTPKTGGLCNNLAWFLTTSELRAHGDPVLANELANKAVEVAMKAVALDPQNSNYRNTLGVARYRARDWTRAISDLKQSVALGNDSSFNSFFLAMAHWRLGNKAEASQWYDQAVAWMEKVQPQNAELRRFRAEAEQVMGIERKKQP